MDNQKVDEILTKYFDQVKALGYQPKRHPPEEKLAIRGSQQALEHVLWMCHEVRSWPAERLEKKFRWLGFVQGVLWREGIQSVEEAKRDNMPEGEEYKP
jgi:hypothetical protein